MRLRLRPPAKLNRFLHIVGRRADGYHLLQTAFELIDWCDELTIETRSDDRVVLIGGTAGVPAERDLVCRAARLLQTLRPEAGCTLHLNKHIPTGAGLGGGSSDAAAVLLGLNRLWNLRLDLPRLLELGLQLGADVPVFLGQTPAYAEGVGERLQALPWVDRPYLVVHPGVELGTAAMFAAADLCRAMPSLSLQDYLAGQPTRNVFEPVARRLSPEVERCFDWVGRFGPARLTGSGSAVYCELTDPAAANVALAALPERWRGRVVRTLTNWFDKVEAEG
ncbi:MAG: 4-(cytidine 5'-diphospho)-2-C-methyl-D-erythritol kinase [Lysobacterales bacterium]